MKAFVWRRVDGITDNYHSGGGVLVIAPDLATARLMVGAQQVANSTSEDDLLVGEPDTIYALAGSPDSDILVFPDAGCC